MNKTKALASRAAPQAALLGALLWSPYAYGSQDCSDEAWLLASTERSSASEAPHRASEPEPCPAATLAEEPGNRIVFAPELHASFLSDVADRSTLNDTIGYGARVGYRVGYWGAYFFAEQNLWGTSENERGISAGVLNLGLGGELLIFDGRVRLSASGGASVLLFDTLLDEAGTFGVFAEGRPGGLRWSIAEDTLLQFDPLSLAVAAPVLSGIPLIQLEYRTTLSVEF